jgi:thioredoxin 1
MKEILIAFLIALVLGSIINGANFQSNSSGSNSSGNSNVSSQATAQVPSVDEASFDQEVLSSKTPVLVDFYTETCPHCKNMAPVLAQLKSEHPEVKIVRVDAMANPSLAQKYNVGPVPAFLVFLDGKKVESSEGEMPKEELAALFLKHLKAASNPNT